MMYIENDKASFYTRLAEIFLTTATASVRERDCFNVALSGGSTPRKLHRLLGDQPFVNKIAWQKTGIFWVDERCVPADNSDSNYGNARADFLEKIPVPPWRIYPMKGELPPTEGAMEYAVTLKQAGVLTETELPLFDLILLGMGRDGHVASLFPGMVPEKDDTKWVIPVKGGSPDVDRLTLTYPVLNRGRTVVFMISGRGKAKTVKTVMENPGQNLPAQFIRPKKGQLIWVLDREAASLL
jgi:6-phosphogluconolactonase